MDKQVEPKSRWHIISTKWVEKWQKYVYFDYLDKSSVT